MVAASSNSTGHQTTALTFTYNYTRWLDVTISNRIAKCSTRCSLMVPFSHLYSDNISSSLLAKPSIGSFSSFPLHNDV